MKELKEKESSARLTKEILLMLHSNSKAEREAGFELLFKSYKPMVFNFLNKSLFSDKETANDLMIDVFTKIHLNIDSYSVDKGALSTWIYKISKNVLLDYIRSQMNIETLSIDCFFDVSSNKGEDENVSRFQIEDKSISNDSSELLIREERAKSLLIALGKMKIESHKIILTLFYLEQKSYEEISQEMNSSISTVKALLHRAKNSLKNVLVKHGFKY